MLWHYRIRNTSRCLLLETDRGTERVEKEKQEADAQISRRCSELCTDELRCREHSAIQCRWEPPDGSRVHSSFVSSSSPVRLLCTYVTIRLTNSSLNVSTSAYASASESLRNVALKSYTIPVVCVCWKRGVCTVCVMNGGCRTIRPAAIRSGLDWNSMRVPSFELIRLFREVLYRIQYSYCIYSLTRFIWTIQTEMCFPYTSTTFN